MIKFNFCVRPFWHKWKYEIISDSEIQNPKIKYYSFKTISPQIDYQLKCCKKAFTEKRQYATCKSSYRHQNHTKSVN